MKILPVHIVSAGIFLSLLFFGILYPFIPISYDEAWNWTNVARYGPRYALTNYPAANNHVFFTVLESIFTPRFLLWYFPEITRLINVIAVAVFFTCIWIVFSKLFKKKSIFWILLFVFICFFVSPLVTPFFIIARGYVLGALFLFVGIYTLSQRKYFLSSALFILSAWTVPTYSYCLPLIYLCAFFLRNQKQTKRLILSGLLIPSVLLLLYIPILSAVFAQRKIWHTGPYTKFILNIFQSLSNYPYVMNGFMNVIYLLLYGISILILIKTASIKVKNFFLLLISAVISYLVTVGIFSVLHKVDPPFLRVGLFIPLFISLTILGAALSVRGFVLRCVFWIVLVVNACIGLYFFTTKLPFDLKNPYPVLADYLVPIPFPISDNQRKLLQQRKITNLSLVHPLDDSVLYYFSQIYHISVKNSLKKQ